MHLDIARIAVGILLTVSALSLIEHLVAEMTLGNEGRQQWQLAWLVRQEQWTLV